MQSSCYSGFPTVYPSFQKTRQSTDLSRFRLNLTPCPVNTSPFWASLPTPPMSGSPPLEPSKDPAQLAGRRRKRSDSPSSTTAITTPTVSALPAIVEPPTPRYGEQPTFERQQEPAAMQIAPHPVPTYLPPLSFGGTAPLGAYPPPDLISSQQQISPRTTRKTKAHVASACINCKKKHLRCDSSRPCRRCVQSGKEDTCRDVEHKKRGRPPLKPEDPNMIGRRAPGPSHLSTMSDPSAHHDPRYAPPTYPTILPNAPPPMYGHHRSSSRSSIYGHLQSPYAAPSVAQSPLTATGSHFSYSTRPQSTSSTVSTQPHSPYIAQPPYSSHMPNRQMQPYTGYPFHAVDMPPTTQPFFTTPLFPRDPIPPPMQPESHYSHGLQLPPIRPVQQNVIDPSISQQRSPGQQPTRQERNQRSESGERDPKRPKMDIQGILGPKSD